MRPVRAHAADRREDLPELPASTVSKDRQLVDLTGEQWSFRTAGDAGTLLRINWTLLGKLSPLSMSPRAMHIAKLYLCWRIGCCKGRTIRNDFGMLRRFLKFQSKSPEHLPLFDWASLDEAAFRGFLAQGMRTADKGNDFASLRALYRWGAFACGFRDFDPRLSVALSAIRAVGNIKGAAVRFRDQVRGPLSSDERESLRRGIASERGRPEDRAVAMLHLELGLNPQSTACMRNADLKVFKATIEGCTGPSAVVVYQLEVPRVKKRTEFRTTKIRPISNRLGDLLTRLRRGGEAEPLFHWLARLSPEASVNTALRRFVKQADVRSERTGHLLHLNARRLRYTLATEAAKGGASRQKIAAVLDHTDLQNVEVYIEADSYVVEQLGARFDRVYEPFVRRFRGEVLEEEPKGGAVVPFDVPGMALDLGGIGVCGRDYRNDGVCGLAPPLTCYKCDFFAAFRSGPHAKVVQSLDRVRQELATQIGAPPLESLDEVILAIRQLMVQIASDTKERL